MPLDPLVVRVAAVTGFVAAAIAVGGFLAHARAAIAGESEEFLRRRTAIGGVLGMIAALLTSAAGALW